MANSVTGWEREHRGHFDGIVERYDQIWPEYPKELFEEAMRYSGCGAGAKAVEIGSGTGKATAPFLNAGFDVTAVETSANMSAFLKRRFAAYPRFSVVTSAFEDVGLESNQYDLIYAASAFHWVDAAIGCPKAYRLLKQGGSIALFRYNQIAGDGDAAYEEIQSIRQKHYYNYYHAGTRPVKKTRQDFEKSSEIFVGYRFEDLGAYGFRDVAMRFYDVEKRYTADEYIALLDTMSDYRSLSEENRRPLYAGIRQAIKRHGDSYRVGYIFQSYMGRK